MPLVPVPRWLLCVSSAVTVTLALAGLFSYEFFTRSLEARGVALSLVPQFGSVLVDTLPESAIWLGVGDEWGDPYVFQRQLVVLQALPAMALLTALGLVNDNWPRVASLLATRTWLGAMAVNAAALLAELSPVFKTAVTNYAPLTVLLGCVLTLWGLASFITAKSAQRTEI